MKRDYRSLALGLALLSPTVLPVALPAQAQKHNYVPARGYVPDAKTAIRIAVAVWSPIYGEKQIQSEKPFHAHLSKGVWTVTGSLPEGWDGGVAMIRIAKSDGRILLVIHSQ